MRFSPKNPSAPLGRKVQLGSLKSTVWAEILGISEAAHEAVFLRRAPKNHPRVDRRGGLPEIRAGPIANSRPEPVPADGGVQVL
jgi:hypothetical protein